MQVHLAEWSEERFNREELDVRFRPSQVVDAPEVVLFSMLTPIQMCHAHRSIMMVMFLCPSYW